MIGTRRPAPNALVPAIALALACACFAGAALAQDPAAISSRRHDPANLDHRKHPPRTGARPAIDPNNPMLRSLGLTSAPTPEEIAARGQAGRPSISDEMNKLQQMMDTAYDSSSSSSRYSSPYDNQMRYDQMMQQSDAIVGRNWDQLSTSTQQFYREMQRLDAEQREEQSRFGAQAFNNPDAAMGMGLRQAEDGMRRLGDALMPVLQDLKNAMDTELQNAARR